MIAPPGAGKTTRVPPALTAEGPVVLLQPRRMAARAVARRIADERGWTVGREIGWQVRFERQYGPATQLLVVTEGVLTAKLQQDPLLSDFHTIVLDEFHERSIHADLAIALTREAWLARADLRMVVMSATLDAEPVSAYLNSCPVVRVSGRQHPLEVDYTPGRSVAEAVEALLARTDGDILCFLPGGAEIARATADIAGRQAHRPIEVLPLHGGLEAAAQDRALRPAADGRRRVVVATNIAETSVTVPRVTAVVDAGLHKVARYDAARGVDHLTLERITQDSADQRAGRAGRVRPGLVSRLWERHARLRPHREPEVHRIDLSGVMLDVLAWGGDPRTLDWFEPPRAGAIDRALGLLGRLGAVEGGQLTGIGRRMVRLPLPPRLARILIEGAGAPAIVKACALIAESRYLPRGATVAASSDLILALDDWATMPPHIRQAAAEIERLAGTGRHAGELTDAEFRRALLAGYPDRIAQRRAPGSNRLRLSSGHGAVLGPQSGVRDGEFIIAIDLVAQDAAARPPGDPRPETQAESRIRMASRVEPEWLVPNAREVIHRLDDEQTVRADSVTRYDALVLDLRPAAVDDETAARLLAEAWSARGPRDEEEQLLRRLRFAGFQPDVSQLVLAAAYGKRKLDDIDLWSAVASEHLAAMDRDAPARISLPSGRTASIDYRSDGSIHAAAKLQELFGLAETPRLGPHRQAVVLALLAPNGRPVQLTSDLRSFWQGAYHEVRRELRGRYPRHPWPEDPWSAQPTARTTRRSQKP